MIKSNRRKPRQTTSRMPGGSAENGNDIGVIKIHENVIATIVRKATCSVEGVVRLAGNALVDNLAEIVGSRKIHDRAITVEIDEISVKIEVKVRLAYGAHVPTVATAIQNAVIEEIEKLTGMTVSTVNVVVDELEVVANSDED